jgi:hypothetical protein
MPTGVLLRRCQNACRSTSSERSSGYQEVHRRYVRHPKHCRPRWHPYSLRLISPHGRRPPSLHGPDRPPCDDSALHSPFLLVLWRTLLGGRIEYQVLKCCQYSQNALARPSNRQMAVGMDEPGSVDRLVFRFLLRLVGSKLVTAFGLSCSVISSYTVWLAL